MKRLVMVLILMAPALQARANTFVGNGGGAGDVELAVTKKQIEEAFLAIKKRSGGEDFMLCKCNSTYQNRSVCEPLRSLSNEQRKYCTQAMVKQAPEIIKLVTNPNAVSFRWTHEEIRVADRGETRAVDAVTNREKREMTINLKRFLELKQFERVFLLTHELLHLTTLDGKVMNDEGAYGPFTGEEGGRHLLNVMGSTAAVLPGEYPHEVKRYRAKLMRSKSWKPFWINFDAGKAGHTSKPSGTFASEDFDRVALTARYALGNWVFAAGIRGESNDKRVLDTIDVEEQKSFYSFGIGYRIFPFGDPETFWGQSHFLLQVMADYMTAELKLKDGIEFSEEVKTWGGNASVNYYVPIFWGFWGYAGLAYEVHPYKYKNVNLEYKENIFSQYLGVAYAF